MVSLCLKDFNIFYSVLIAMLLINFFSFHISEKSLFLVFIFEINFHYWSNSRLIVLGFNSLKVFFYCIFACIFSNEKLLSYLSLSSKSLFAFKNFYFPVGLNLIMMSIIFICSCFLCLGFVEFHLCVYSFPQTWKNFGHDFFKHFFLSQLSFPLEILITGILGCLNNATTHCYSVNFLFFMFWLF